MSLDLDKFLTDLEKQEFILSVASRALDRANRQAHRMGRLFIDLLDGKLKTTPTVQLTIWTDAVVQHFRPWLHPLTDGKRGVHPS